MSTAIKYETVCLCGSTKFKELFETTNKKFTLLNYIVLSVGHFPHQESVNTSDEVKTQLDLLHLEKIRRSDLVFIINPEGYIGKSTAKELIYAYSLGKRIEYYCPTLNVYITKLMNEGVDVPKLLEAWEATKPK